MRTRTRNRAEEDLSSLEFEEDNSFDLELESLTDEELEEILFEEQEKKDSGIWNLPTMAGLSMILVGIVYMLQELGFLTEFSGLSAIVPMLPLIAGMLIILLGFGVLSWRPKKKTTKKVQVDLKAPKPKVKVETKASHSRKKLRKSRDKKVSGVAAGIAEYFNIDPTLVRIAFVIGTIASGGPFFLAYIILGIIMPKPESDSAKEERITIIRDS